MSSEPIGPIANAITTALTESLEPIHLQVINESHMHNVPKDAETHFKVLVVSTKFESLPLIKVDQSLQQGMHNCTLRSPINQTHCILAPPSRVRHC